MANSSVGEKGEILVAQMGRGGRVTKWQGFIRVERAGKIESVRYSRGRDNLAGAL